MYTKNARTNSTVKMVGFITIFVLKIWLSLTSAEFRSEGFKQTFIKSFDTIETSQNMKTLIQCCSFCLAKSPCEAVQYDGKSCTSLSNVLPTTIGTSQAWVMIPYVSNKAKVLLVGGLSEGMELLNLATQQSYTFDFPLTWSEGGQVSEHAYHFCAYHNNKKCLLLNTQSFETEDSGVTVELQKGSKGLTIEYEGEQVIWLTGGKDGSWLRTSQMTSLMENKPGPAVANLPVALNVHCMVNVNTTTVAIIAGYTGTSNSNKMWYFHFMDDQWVEGPNLRFPRRFSGCGTFDSGEDTYIIAVGGVGSGNGGKSVEILNIKGNNWFDGPDMPFNSEETMVGSLANSLEGEVAWVFGGIGGGTAKLDFSTVSDAILRLHCQGQPKNGECQWIYHDQRLKDRRIYGKVITF